MSNMSTVPNELDPRLMGVSALQPYAGGISSPRVQMFSSHITQRLCISDPTERFIQTGMEKEYGKYTFSIKMPCDAQIIAIIDRYEQGGSLDSITGGRPQTIVIFEDVENKEVGMLSIPEYCSYHQYFGFPYVQTQGMNMIKRGGFVPKGTILADTTAKTPTGEYMYGREANVIFMEVPGVAEDGIIVARSFLKHLRYHVYETRVVEWGNKRFPLNAYGTVDRYKPFPDLGEFVRDDSILMALRNHDKDTAIMDQSIYSTMMIDPTYDLKVYVSRPGGRVIDIRVQHDPYSAPMTTPEGMEVQAEKYDRARRQFHQKILDTYRQLKKQRGQNLRLHPEFHRLVVESLGVIENNEERKIQKLYRKTPLDDYRIEFVIEHVITPGVGAKLTDTSGGKGVVVQIWDDDDMPIDAFGNRADIIMGGNATVNRMNPSRFLEQYTNAASRDVRKRIMLELMNDPQTPIVDHQQIGAQPSEIHAANVQLSLIAKDRTLPQRLATIERTNPVLFDKVWSYLLGYYKFVNPVQENWFTSGQYHRSRADHLASVLQKGVFLFYPPNNQREQTDVIRDLEAYYPPMRSPVTYRGNSRIVCTTRATMLVGSLYIMLLEKTGDDWAAVPSAKTQCFGVLAQITNADKYAQPWRSQAIRAYGESEVRILVSYAGAEITADILDRNNNPETHKAILYSIYGTPQPTNIDQAVDRTKVQYGGSKPLQLTNHILECAGTRFKYTPYVPNWPEAPKSVWGWFHNAVEWTKAQWKKLFGK